jgi:protein-S-isoprenylcysteine O-methyltransferase Ste14
VRRQIGLVAWDVFLYALFLFAPAGTLRWPRAWVLLAVFLVLRISGTIRVWRVNRDVLVERGKPPVQKGQPLVDRILLLSFMATYAGVVAVSALDRFRWHLLPPPPAAVSAAGLVLFVAGWEIVTAVLRTNAFASTVVRHQEERAHAVVDTGVYAIVRHPMYAGLAPVIVGLALWLESWTGAIAAVVPIGILAMRILAEERFLRRELPGYAAYASRVRWRLLPGIW